MSQIAAIAYGVFDKGGAVVDASHKSPFREIHFPTKCIGCRSCVAACPVGARIFGDLADPASNVSQALAKYPATQLRKALGTEPRVYYLPARREAESEVCHGKPDTLDV